MRSDDRRADVRGRETRRSTATGRPTSRPCRQPPPSGSVAARGVAPTCPRAGELTTGWRSDVHRRDLDAGRGRARLRVEDERPARPVDVVARPARRAAPDRHPAAAVRRSGVMLAWSRSVRCALDQLHVQPYRAVARRSGRVRGLVVRRAVRRRRASLGRSACSRWRSASPPRSSRLVSLDRHVPHGPGTAGRVATDRRQRRRRCSALSRRR